jgi:hypothetical protein
MLADSYQVECCVHLPACVLLLLCEFLAASIRKRHKAVEHPNSDCRCGDSVLTAEDTEMPVEVNIEIRAVHRLAELRPRMHGYIAEPKDLRYNAFETSFTVADLLIRSWMRNVSATARDGPFTSPSTRLGAGAPATEV